MAHPATPGHSVPRRVLASALTAVLAAFGAGGCTSVGMNTLQNAAPDPATCAIDVRVFDRASDVKAAHPSAGRVTSDLETISGEAVHHVDGPVWSLEGLSPGEYRLTIRQWKKGSRSVEPDADASKTFTLRPGDRLAVNMVARKFTTGAALGVGLGVASAAAVVVVISEANRAFSNWEVSLASQRSTEPVPLGAATSPVPGGAMPSPEEFEKLARTVAKAFPE